MHFTMTCIHHSVTVIVLDFAFHTEDPDAVGNAISIFLFLELSPLAGSEAALLARRWDAVLRWGT